ncbi:LysR family transcriptional regulator [Salipiger sp.]|uniref:LysR family transcriptional regulator n=1 Tax=Salipiger sp. TaxID=2078585 RepID=UPI003A9737E3
MTDWTALPPLSSLRAFAAYAETGSVAQAGVALNVSHAAISQQIRNLESHLGLTLLDRSSRRMQLTAEGQRLALALSQAFGNISQEIEELTGRDLWRPVLVSSTPSFASSWLMPRLSSFRAAHPEISLMIDPSVEVKTLEPGGIDVALRYGAGQWPGLDAEELVRSPIVVVAAPGLVGDREIASAEDLKDLHWLQEFGTSEVSDWLTRQGVTQDRKRTITALPGNLMIEAARQGQGVAISAKAFIQDDIAAGRLRLLFEDDRHKGYHLVTRPGVQRLPVRNFIRWLRREAGKS